MIIVAPGQLRHRLQIQRATNTASATGQLVPTWRTLATVWGQVESLDSAEAPGADGQTVVFGVYKVTVRYFAGLSALDRMIWLDPVRNHYLNIVSDPSTDGRKRWHQFTCREVAPWAASPTNFTFTCAPLGMTAQALSPRA